MKKIALSLIAISFSMSFASYQVMYPNQLVNFKNIPPETFTPTDPLISDWANIGSVYECSNYTPDAADFDIGVGFTQTANDCKVEQERTVQNRQISSITQAVSNVGEPITEKQTLTDQSSNREATGTRYNYILYVGSYVAWGTPSYGYFSQSYMNTYQGSVSMSVSGSMSSYSFRGSSIDHLVEQNGNITLRLLPSVTGNAPSLTINGVTCTLNGPTIYSSYDAYNCNMGLINNVGKNLYIDLR